MVSHRGECQLVFSINWNFDDVLEAVQNSPYTTVAEHIDEKQASGKLTFRIKGAPSYKVQVSNGSTVSIYVLTGRPELKEFMFLLNALKDVFWDKSGNPDNIVFKKFNPSPAWMREVFYQSEDGKLLLRLEEQYRRESEET